MLYQTKNPHGGDIYAGDITLDFSANTNPYGTPEGVRQAIRDCLCRLDRYPDPYCRQLTAAIAAFEGVRPEYILCGNGAAELIRGWCAAVRIFPGTDPGGLPGGAVQPLPGKSL